MQLERAGPDVADVEAGLGDEQLPLRVDDAERARHFGQVVDDDGAVWHRLFEQLFAANVEPEQLARLRIVGWPLAEMAGDVGEDSDRDFTHWLAPAKTASQAVTAATARSRTASTLIPGENRLDPRPKVRTPILP